MKRISYVITLAAALVTAGWMAVPTAQAAAGGVCADEVTAGGWVVTGETTSNFGLNGGVQDTILEQGQLDFVHAETDCHVFGPLIQYNQPEEFLDVEGFEQCAEDATCRQLIYDVTIQMADGTTIDGTAVVVVCDDGEGPNAEDTFSIAVFAGDLVIVDGLITNDPIGDCSVECETLVGGDVQLHVYGNCP